MIATAKRLLVWGMGYLGKIDCADTWIWSRLQNRAAPIHPDPFDFGLSLGSLLPYRNGQFHQCYWHFAAI